jgi:hypothetical protein
MVWLLLYAHRHRNILGAAGHIILTPANQLMEEYNSEPPEQSCLLRWIEKIASLCFCPNGDQTPYLLIRSPPLIDDAAGSGQACVFTFAKRQAEKCLNISVHSAVLIYRQSALSQRAVNHYRPLHRGSPHLETTKQGFSTFRDRPFCTFTHSTNERFLQTKNVFKGGLSPTRKDIKTPLKQHEYEPLLRRGC